MKCRAKTMSKSRKFLLKSVCLIFCIILTFAMVIQVNAESKNDELIVGGCLFGLKMQTNGIPIVGISKVVCKDGDCSPAYDSGMRIKDVILSINGINVLTASQVTKMIEQCSNGLLTFKVKRNEQIININVKPQKGLDGKNHIGIMIRDSAAGIGTITYIDPSTLEFAGLGHGICDSDTYALLPLSRGIVTEAKITNIIKGKQGCPGEIQGTFNSGKKGALIKNTSTGVYGIYSKLPSEIGQTLPIGRREDVKEGKAKIRSSVSGKIEEYDIIITKINSDSNPTKNLKIKIADKRLLSLTGGIIQGMSGSPIIQNGKLIGAVTHVLVNDPTCGYGIFIENMINAVQMPLARAS